MSAIHWARLTIAADQVDDAERLRIATANRYRALVDDKHLANSPESKALEAQLEAVKTVERIAVLELRRAMRVHPLGEWCQQQVGIGEKTLARLLGVIGDPTTRLDQETGEVHERTLSQLRSYCGYGNAETQRRRRGEKSNWNAEARKRLHIIADCCVKQRQSPYRVVYDEARVKYEPCDISDGHKHMRAMRAIKKAFLKDLWQEARRVHSCTETHSLGDATGNFA